MKRRSVRLAIGLAAILAAAEPLFAAGDKTITATGTVTKLEAAGRAVFVAVASGPETRFVWTADTKINGTLSQGAKVTVRYTTLPDGQNLAHQISVAK
jgi:ferric-dicitrate binding protein FerR (iron transport regulator)